MWRSGKHRIPQGHMVCTAPLWIRIQLGYTFLWDKVASHVQYLQGSTNLCTQRRKNFHVRRKTSTNWNNDHKDMYMVLTSRAGFWSHTVNAVMTCRAGVTFFGLCVVHVCSWRTRDRYGCTRGAMMPNPTNVTYKKNYTLAVGTIMNHY